MPAATLETRRVVHRTQRRVILTHSPALHAAQVIGFSQNLNKAQAKLVELTETLARSRGGGRLPRTIRCRIRVPPTQGPHVASFSPMHHWTEHTIRMHTFTCGTPCKSPTSCAAKPKTPAHTSPYVNFWTSSPESKKSWVIHSQTSTGTPDLHRYKCGPNWPGNSRLPQSMRCASGRWTGDAPASPRNTARTRQ